VTNPKIDFAEDYDWQNEPNPYQNADEEPNFDTSYQEELDEILSEAEESSPSQCNAFPGIESERASRGIEIGKRQEQAGKKGLGQKISEARRTHEQRVQERQQTEMVKTRRELVSQRDKTALAELKKKERMSKPSRMKSIRKAATLGGSIKVTNKGLYTGHRTAKDYVPQPVSPYSSGRSGKGSLA
jgi:hypothetical protein